MRIDVKIPDRELDAILLSTKAPEPRKNLTQNVWREIRCAGSEYETSTAWEAIPWMAQASIYVSVLMLVAGTLFLGYQVGHALQPHPTEVQISVLQSQTLAGSYLAIHSGS